MSELVIPYRPRAYQRRIHDAATRFVVLIAHRRCGKTVAGVNHAIRGAFRCALPNPQIAYIAPNAKQAKRIAWRYFLHFTAGIPGRKVNASDLTIQFQGATLFVLGSENVDALRGMYLDGAILDEFAQMHPDAWDEVILPALLDRDGWALIEGTPKGENRLSEVWHEAASNPDFTRIMLKASETGALSEKALAIARRNMSQAKYEQEFECSFLAVLPGAYYAELMATALRERRITDVPYDPSLGVTVAVDLGMADAFAAWFLQEDRNSGRVRAIDYREWSYYDGYAQIKREIDGLGYAITRWIAPHDIRVTEQGTGKTRFEQAAAVGMPFEVAPRMSLEDGIEAVRVLLPRMAFDEVKCKTGLTALRQYRTDWDDVKKIGSKKPLHDWTSHGCDALRTYATARGVSSSDWTVSTAELAAVQREQRAARASARRGYGRGARA